jgi:predicted 3-demethylubiquinone-9 3-methyltransferase (glyoxalase superfamily)
MSQVTNKAVVQSQTTSSNKEGRIQRITPCLWFDSQAEEAARFYVSIFKNSKIGNVMRYDEASSKAAGKPAGSVLTVEFELEGQQFIGLNGGPMFKFSEAVSFMIKCDTQEEIDYFWKKLTSDGGEESMCGWLKDKFGLSWQVVPDGLQDMLQDPDPERSKRVMNALLEMRKVDLPALERAFEGQE